MAGLRRTGSLLVIALMPWVLTGCASSSSRLARLHRSAAESQEQTWARAQLAEQEGRYAEAQQAYAELHRRDLKSVQYAHRLGVVCTMLSDHERARTAYEHARLLDPNNPELLADIGYSEYLQKNYVEAEKLLRASLEQVANNPRAKTNLALAIGCQGRYDECLALFREVHGQDEAEVLCNMAYVRSQRGEIAEATRLYKQVLAIDPTFQKASAGLAQLKSAESAPRTVAEKPYRKYMNQNAPVVAAAPAKPAAEPEPQTAGVQTAATEDVAAVEASGVTQTSNQEVAEIVAEEFVAEELAEEQRGDEEPTAAAEESSDLAFWDEEETDLNPPSSGWVPRKLPESHKSGAAPIPSAPISTPSPLVESQTVTTEQTVTTDETPFAVVEESPDDSLPTSNELETQSDTPGPLLLADETVGTRLSVTEQFGPEWLASRTEQIAARKGQTGFMGFCPVALRDELKLVDALPQYTAEYQSQRIQFSSEEAMRKFQAKPERYLPAAGGLDVVAIAQGTAVAQGSLEHALWFRHKLYLFINRENMELFRAQAREFAVQD